MDKKTMEENPINSHKNKVFFERCFYKIINLSLKYINFVTWKYQVSYRGIRIKSILWSYQKKNSSISYKQFLIVILPETKIDAKTYKILPKMSLQCILKSMPTNKEFHIFLIAVQLQTF